MSIPYNIPPDREVAESARACIINNLDHMYSIPELAAASGTIPSALHRIFKKHFGVSVCVFSRNARMEAAKHLLSATNNTIQMIAESLGYTEGNNFQTAFKRIVGCTPGEWRRKFK